MVEWIQYKPEVIAYVRGMYTDDALPDWVGKLEGNVNYREFLQSKGVEVPSVDDSSMEDTTADNVDSSITMDEKADEEDVAEGIPVQGARAA